MAKLKFKIRTFYCKRRVTSLAANVPSITAESKLPNLNKDLSFSDGAKIEHSTDKMINELNEMST